MLEGARAIVADRGDPSLSLRGERARVRAPAPSLFLETADAVLEHGEQERLLTRERAVAAHPRDPLLWDQGGGDEGHLTDGTTERISLPCSCPGNGDSGRARTRMIRARCEVERGLARQAVRRRTPIDGRGSRRTGTVPGDGLWPTEVDDAVSNVQVECRQMVPDRGVRSGSVVAQLPDPTRPRAPRPEGQEDSAQAAASDATARSPRCTALARAARASAIALDGDGSPVGV